MTEYDQFLQLPDEQLCELVAKGESVAEDILAERYLRLVRVCSRPYFIAGATSEDVAQEGTIGLIKAIREYNPEKNVPFYAFAELCINNRIRSSVRSSNRDKNIALNTYVPTDPSSPNGVFVTDSDLHHNLFDPEEQYLSRERFEELSSAIKDLLTPLELDVLAYYLEGLTYADISVRIDRSIKSVDNTVQRIRRKLSRFLGRNRQL